MGLQNPDSSVQIRLPPPKIETRPIGLVSVFSL